MTSEGHPQVTMAEHPKDEFTTILSDRPFVSVTLSSVTEPSSTRTNGVVKVLTETTDHTIVFQTVSVHDPPITVDSPDPNFSLSPFVSGVSPTTAVIPAAPAVSSRTTTASITSVSTPINATTPILTLNANTSVSLSFSSAPTETTTTASTLSPVSAPSASVYTTGLYIALGLFLFFAILCALVTSPAVAEAVKAFFRRRAREPEQ